MRNFKVQILLVLNDKKKNDSKIFHPIAKLIVTDSEIDEALKSIHQSIMTKIKNSASEDWIIIETIVIHSIKNFECA